MIKTKIALVLAISLALFIGLVTFKTVSAQFYPTSNSSVTVNSGCVSGGLYSYTTGLPCTQSITVMPPDPTLFGCITITNNIYFGSSDRRNNFSNVARYQSFLISNGYLRAGLATGYFGPATLLATKRFQSANNIPNTGYVGSLTRARITALTCGGGVIPPVGLAPVITSLNPTSGPFGTIVTIYGRGFNRTGNSVNFGGVTGIASNISSYDGVSIQFTIPASPCRQDGTACNAIAFAPGQNFMLSVSNSSGTSNALTFNVTNPNAQNLPPTISGIDGPTNLAVGQQGTWTVRAIDQTGAGLSYQVTWGDENQLYGGYYYASSNTYAQTSTFTHVYNQAGTYTSRFTVRGSNGFTAEASITVQVGSNTTNVTPIVTSLSPTSGPAGTSVMLTGENFSRFDNRINFAGVNSAITGVPSYDARTLVFTVPATPCTQGNFCAQVVLSPGTYPVSVSTSYGTSSSVYFALTSEPTSVNQSITLALDQLGVVNDFRITPKQIIEDSRCPIGVQCIQAGRVVVRTTLGVSFSGMSIDMPVSQEYTLDGYRVKITSVTPERYYNQGISNDQYRITYQVTR